MSDELLGRVCLTVVRACAWRRWMGGSRGEGEGAAAAQI